VIEVDRNNNVVWQFGDGSVTPGPTSIVAPNDAEPLGNFTLISGTGTSTNPDNRVIVVGPTGKIVWQYGQAGIAGSGFNQLNTPVCAVFLPNEHVLITDQVNERVIEVTLDRQIVWQYGTTGMSGAAADQLNNPNSAELLENGNILIADENNNRVIEVDRNHNIVWQYGNPNDTSILNGAAFASRLPNGNTLITDSLNNRIVEVTMTFNVVFTYVTNDPMTRPGTVAQPNPTRAVRLTNGDTLISDQFNDQVIEVDGGGNIVFSQGSIGVVGNGFDLLNAPYDAKVIGDFTGLTVPFNDHDQDDPAPQG
jgi:outer membrane protein assembly factor BamB